MKDPRSSARIERCALGVWLGGSTLFLLGLIMPPLRNIHIPVKFGLIDAPGMTTIWVLVAAGICGAAAELALLRGRTVGAALLTLGYSLFWLVNLIGGMAEAAARTTNFALEQLRWETWLVGGMIYLTMLSGFLLSALWCLEQLRE